MDYGAIYIDDYGVSESEEDEEDEEDDDGYYGGFFPTNLSVPKQKEEFDLIFAPFQVSFKDLNKDCQFNKRLNKIRNNVIHPSLNQKIPDPIPPPICNIKMSFPISHSQSNSTPIASQQLLQTTIIDTTPTTQSKPTPIAPAQLVQTYIIVPTPHTQSTCAPTPTNWPTISLTEQPTSISDPLPHTQRQPTPTTSSQSIQAKHSPANPRIKIKNNKNNLTKNMNNVLNQCPNNTHVHQSHISDPTSACATSLTQHTTTTNSIDVKYSKPIKPFKSSLHTTLITPTTKTPILKSYTQSLYIDTSYLTVNKRSENINNNNFQPQRNTHNISKNTYCSTYNLIGITLMYCALIIMSTFIFHLYFGLELPSMGRERDLLQVGEQSSAPYCKDQSVIDQEYEKKYLCYELYSHGIWQNSANNAFIMAYQSHVSNRHGIGIFDITLAVKSEKFPFNYFSSKSDESFIFYFQESIVYLSIFDIIKGVKQTLTSTKYLNKIVGGLGDPASALLHLLQRSYLSIGLYFFGGFGFLFHLFYCLIIYSAGVFTVLVAALNHYYV